MTPSDDVYLDHNATAPLRPAAAEAMQTAIAEGGTLCGNPSSIHRHGRRARQWVEDAREAVAALVGVPASWVVFTSGGSEADGLALSGPGPGPRLCSAVEHDAVLRWVAADDRVPVDDQGVLRLDALERALAAAPAPGVLSLMAANNETGVIQPVADAARLAHAAGWRVHCDAVQAVGRMPSIELDALGVDMMTLSAHKVGGPAGAGALIVREGVTLAPLIRGGGQERGRRAGTENVIGIAGFGAAVAAMGPDQTWATEIARLSALQTRLEDGIRALNPHAIVYGRGARRLPNTTCVGLPEGSLPADIQVMRLDLAGVSVGAGSACSSGKVTPSHVLRAMGVEEDAARRAIRVSLGWSSTLADVERFLEAWAALSTPGVLLGARSGAASAPG